MQTQTATLLNHSVSYSILGTGKPLLILHGWGSSSKVMLPLAQVMSQHHTCYVVDFPGFGASSIPDSAWDVGTYSDFTQAFISEIIGEKSDIIAHSFGGRVMLKLLARPWSNGFIGKVLITGGAGMKPKRSWKFYYRKYLAKLLKAPFQLLPGSLKTKGLANLRNTDLWKSLGSSDYQALQGTMREVFVKTVAEYLEKHLPEINHEVFLLWGKNDDATPWYQAERIHKGIKNSALVGIDDAGHYAFLDKPNQFYAIANAYLNP
jgi:pimeloyl-ACP methyl ester carboxylesterase